ncbi:MAG: hypothetical protein Q9159_004048 [Coniocarpon cinnabarinum]
MEDLRVRHRKEAKDLQSQVTQKKKSATKKTRKTINDDCERLEQELKQRHNDEIAQFTSGSAEAGTVNRDVGDPAHSNGEQASTESDLLASIIASTADKLQNIGIDGEGSTLQENSQAASRKPNRQKARLARRAAEQDAARTQAAEEAASMPDMKAVERNKMLEEIRKHDLREMEVAANGHCLYLAMADQIDQRGLTISADFHPSKADTSSRTQAPSPDFSKVRAAAADYIAANSSEFEPFLEEPLPDYLHKIRDTGEWGGQLELTALAKAYKININVLQATGRLERFEAEEGSDKAGEAWLAYYRHGFGLGEHYNSLRQMAADSKPD